MPHILRKIVFLDSPNVIAHRVAGRGTIFDVHQSAYTLREWKLLKTLGSLIAYDSCFYKVIATEQQGSSPIRIGVVARLLRADTVAELAVRQELEVVLDLLNKKKDEVKMLTEELGILETELKRLSISQA